MRGNIRLNNPAQSKSEIVMRDIVVAALIIFFLVFFILPIIAVLFGSFYRWNPLKNQMIYLGLDNWKKVFTSDLFWLSIQICNAAASEAYDCFYRNYFAYLLFPDLYSGNGSYRRRARNADISGILSHLSGGILQV